MLEAIITVIGTAVPSLGVYFNYKIKQLEVKHDQNLALLQEFQRKYEDCMKQHKINEELILSLQKTKKDV